MKFAEFLLCAKYCDYLCIIWIDVELFSCAPTESYVLTLFLMKWILAVTGWKSFYPRICHSIYVNKGMLTSMIICVNIPHRMVPLFNYILKLYLALDLFPLSDVTDELFVGIMTSGWDACSNRKHLLTCICIMTFKVIFSIFMCICVCVCVCVWLCGRALCWCCSWLNNWNIVPACCGRSYYSSNS